MDVSGQTKGDIASRLDAKAGPIQQVAFSYDGKTHSLKAPEIGLVYDTQKTAALAANHGKSSPLEALWRSLVSPFHSSTVEPVVVFNAAVAADKLLVQTNTLASPAKNATISRNGAEFVAVRESPGTVVDTAASLLLLRLSLQRFNGSSLLVVRPQEPDITVSTLAPARGYATQLANLPLTIVVGDAKREPSLEEKASWVTFVRHETGELSKVIDQDLIGQLDRLFGVGQGEAPIISDGTRTLHAAPNETALGSYIADIAPDYDKPPVNARLSFENNQLTVMGAAVDGTVVDRKAAVAAMAQGFTSIDRSIALPVVRKQADIRQETLPQLGITTRIGTATTYFGGSPVNRTYNIGVGAKQFNGILIKPGESFSFNRVLGDVGPETGYLPELVIKENKTVPEYGGGLCQVSTTMFRAAMSAGLPITERTNHAYAVHYYAPIGMDATIYPPNPDMKFRNNTGKYILVQTAEVGQSLTFDFYGTSDGRQASTQIISINASEQDGGTASFRYVVNGGAEPIDTIFSSTYLPQSKFPISRSFN
jgi:vancomycin resistance protein YoaR